MNYENQACGNEGSRHINNANKNFLYQLTRHPTRVKIILDLISTNEKNFIENIFAYRKIVIVIRFCLH